MTATKMNAQEIIQFIAPDFSGHRQKYLPWGFVRTVYDFSVGSASSLY